MTTLSKARRAASEASARYQATGTEEDRAAYFRAADALDRAKNESELLLVAGIIFAPIVALFAMLIA
jgi:hypothetical protein